MAARDGHAVGDGPAGPSGTGVHAVLAGGGTAGHVVPGLAIAAALEARGHPRSSLVFAGAATGMEHTMVPAAGYHLEELRVRNFPRSLTPVRHARSAWMELVALRDATAWIARHRPRVVVSLGGFASVPWVLAARRQHVPVVVVSYDAVPGRASRWQATRAAATAVAFTDVALPRARLTGTPLRPDVVAVDRSRDRAAARVALGLPSDAFVVVAFGGSLGSGPVNAAVRALVEQRADDTGLAVHHVIGARNAASFTPPVTRGITYHVVPFEERMATAYAAADLAVARAGATSVAELAAVGLPALLAPWPLAAEDHQTANARWLVDAGAAVLLTDAELPVRLHDEVQRLRARPDVLAAMGAAGRSVARPHAADDVAALVDEVAGRGLA